MAKIALQQVNYAGTTCHLLHDRDKMKTLCQHWSHTGRRRVTVGTNQPRSRSAERESSRFPAAPSTSSTSAQQGLSRFGSAACNTRQLPRMSQCYFCNFMQLEATFALANKKWPNQPRTLHITQSWCLSHAGYSRSPIYTSIKHLFTQPCNLPQDSLLMKQQ